MRDRFYRIGIRSGTSPKPDVLSTERIDAGDGGPRCHKNRMPGSAVPWVEFARPVDACTGLGDEVPCEP